MLFLIIVTLVIGVMYTWMGAFICFRKRYGLISNYIADEKAGRFGEDYARRVGWIWLVSGVLCLGSVAVAMAAGKAWLSVALMLGCIVGSLIAYSVNHRRSDRLRG